MKYNQKINNIRAFAILIVVLGHSIILYSSQWALYESERTCVALDYAKQIINLFQMPLYFSISGYLFSMRWGERKAGRFIVNKVRRLIVPFFAIGMMWMIPIKLLLRYPHYEGRSYLGALFMLLNGSDVGHLWYLPTLFLIFIIVYFVIRILGNSATVWTIALIVTLVINVLEKQLPSFGIIYLSNTYRYAWGFVFGAFIYKTEIENIQKSITWISIGIAILSSTYCIYGGRTTSIIAPISILLSIYLALDQHKSRTTSIYP